MTRKDILDLDTSKDKTILGVYIIWVIIHIVLFATSGNYWTDDFYPIRYYEFNFGETQTYDYSEFLTYTIIPVLLFLAYKLLRPNKG